jgi:hypothetical protein
MNKSELIDAAADRSSVSNAGAGATIDPFFEVLTSAVKGGETAARPSCGSFVPLGRPPYGARAKDRRSSGHHRFDPDEVHTEQFARGELNRKRKQPKNPGRETTTHGSSEEGVDRHQVRRGEEVGDGQEGARGQEVNQYGQEGARGEEVHRHESVDGKEGNEYGQEGTGGEEDHRHGQEGTCCGEEVDRQEGVGSEEVS